MLTKNRLSFKNRIARWDEAIPLGNGSIGALIWGDAENVRFSIDLASLWDLRLPPEIKTPDFNIKTLCRLIEKGEAGREELNRKFCDFYEGYPYPTKLPAGALELKTEGNPGACLFSLDIRKGICFFSSNDYEFEAFSYRAEDALIIRLSGERRPSASLIPPDFAGKGESGGIFEQSAVKEGLKALGYGECSFFREKPFEYFVQPTYEGHCYCMMIAREWEKDSEKIALTVKVGDLSKKESMIAQMKAALFGILGMPYARLKKSQTDFFRGYWQSCRVSLPDRTAESLWYLYNYYLASLSRPGGLPIALQGIWTADNGGLPPWKGDYHNDLNLQMTYWSYPKNNRLEQGSAYIEYLQNTKPAAANFARSFYRSNGICMPSTADVNGNPMGGWAQYSYNLTTQCWLCQAMVWHYEYTADLKFLEQTAYPYLKESAQCVTENLIEDREGKLLLPYSVSPEIYDNGLKAWLKPNSNYDLALLKFLFLKLTECARVLQNGEDAEWQKIYGQLGDFYYDETGLMFDSETRYFESHRHLGHAMAIYPLDLLDYGRDKKLIDDTLRQIEAKGYDYFVGFSFPWMALLYTRLYDGGNAYRHLKLFSDNFISVNGFNLNGDYKRNGVSKFDYRPFTLEGNFAYVAALNEMLLKDTFEILHFFPAVPTEWDLSSIEIKGFRVRGGLIVDAAFSDGGLRVCIASHSAAQRELIFNSCRLAVNIEPGKNVFILSDIKNCEEKRNG